MGAISDEGMLCALRSRRTCLSFSVATQACAQHPTRTCICLHLKADSKRASRTSLAPYMPVLSQNTSRPPWRPNSRPCVNAFGSCGNSRTTSYVYSRGAPVAAAAARSLTAASSVDFSLRVVATGGCGAAVRCVLRRPAVSAAAAASSSAPAQAAMTTLRWRRRRWLPLLGLQAKSALAALGSYVCVLNE